MANISEDPPSPVDAYETPAAPPPPPYASTPQYAPSAYGVPARRTNVLAIVSLILSCAGLIFWFLLPIGGVITGHIALSQIKRTGDAGRGMALAGVIVGYALIGISLIVIVIYIVVIAIAVGTAGSDGAFNSGSFG